MIQLPHQQIGLDHVPDRPLGSVAVVALHTLPIVMVGPLNMVGGPGAVEVVDERGF